MTARLNTAQHHLMTDVLIQRRENTEKHTGKKARQRQNRLQLYSNMPRNVKDCQKPPEARKEA